MNNCFCHAECHWLVPVPEEHTAADVIQGTDHPQTADSAARCARPRLPSFQLHLHSQQLHTCTGVRALQTEPQVMMARMDSHADMLTSMHKHLHKRTHAANLSNKLMSSARASHEQACQAAGLFDPPGFNFVPAAAVAPPV